ncbi:MAG: hypothetical protein P8Z37_16405 [Acidobacteriota bacterium]
MLKMNLSDNSLKVLGLAVLLSAACFSVGYYQFDEHFQILEFAGLKLDLAVPDNMPWEYFQQMRPAIQPALVVLLYNALSWFGIENPFTVALGLRLISALLAFICMWLTYEAFRDEIRDPILKRWFLILSFLLWFAVFVGVRYSSENWSISALVGADQKGKARKPGSSGFRYRCFRRDRHPYRPMVLRRVDHFRVELL